MPSPPDFCPNCGVEVPPRARACPECGADESTGWSEKAKTQGLDLPDDEFDYDRFVKEEFGSPAARRGPPGSWVWWLAGILLLLVFVLAYLR
jgi:hypothetical protein